MAHIETQPYRIRVLFNNGFKGITIPSKHDWKQAYEHYEECVESAILVRHEHVERIKLMQGNKVLAFQTFREGRPR